MRTLKFRAWDGLRMTTNGICFINTTGTINGEVFGVGGGIEKMPIMQFTGLLDKNGKEIYESDFLMETEYKRDEYFTYTVKWDNGRYVAENNQYPHRYRETDCFDCMVLVGNIYEYTEFENE